MPNMLTVDDATFAGGVGHWNGTSVQPLATLSRATTPVSPDGNAVLKFTKPSTAFRSMQAKILTGIYTTFVGQYHRLEFAYSVPGTNTGTGPLQCRGLIVTYALTGAGAGEGNFISAPFNPGDGWHQLTGDIVVAVPGSVWVGIDIRFEPVTNSSPFGFVTGDLAYVSDVVLSDTPILPVGGWGVGMIRMGT